MADKIFTFIIIMSMISILLALVGIQSGANAVMGAFGISSTGIGWYGSTIQTIMAALLLAGGALIVVGFITRSFFESSILITTGLIALLVSFALDFVNLIGYGFEQGQFAGWIALIVLGPLYTGFVMSIVQFWRGAD